jgi:hypothetical protein
MRGQIRVRAAASAISVPSTITAPSWIARAPARIDSSEDLPTPSGPIRPISRPAGNAVEMQSSAVTAP